MKDERWRGVDGSQEVDTVNSAQIYKEEEKIDWEFHPLNSNVKLGYFLTKQDDGVEVTCILGRVPKGETIPEHTHKVYDILFPLSGKAQIWIKGLGDLELRKGVLVCVPPEVAHKVYNVTEDLEVFDVFSSAII